jgi:hypothetical protein
MEAAISGAEADGRHVLVHVVHGSKTGLILPDLGDLERLRHLHGDCVTFVVDACQARITGPAIADYLARGAIVFVTGSNSWAARRSAASPWCRQASASPLGPSPTASPPSSAAANGPKAGRAPKLWRTGANPGLLLRLEASIFELERFQRLSVDEVTRVILCFHQAVREEIVEKTPAHRVAPYPPGEKETADTHPIEMRTLSTLDLSEFAGGATFDDSTAGTRPCSPTASASASRSNA